MINIDQCGEGNGLLYRSFTIVYMQTFTTMKLCKYEKELSLEENGKKSSLCVKEIEEDEIDNQLFTHKEKIVDRYSLKGFDINVDILDEDGNVTVTLKGHVKVKISFFFRNTALISFRVVVPAAYKKESGYKDIFCSIDKDYINSDELINLASLVQGAECWTYNKTKDQQVIDAARRKQTITNFPIDRHGRLREECPDNFTEPANLEEAFNHYRAYFDKSFNKCRNEFVYESSNYTMIDVWEDFAHDGENIFLQMKEEGRDADIVAHLETHHRAELVGVMSYYPGEWPYRMAASFQDICGNNIAIDTDDLVLANSNVCLVFGTYGNRESWSEHLYKRARYHVSWPEYLYLLELVLIRKHTLNYAIKRYSFNSQKAITHKRHKSFIADNANLSLQLTSMVNELNTIRQLKYVSHKHMYKMTVKELAVVEDEEQFKTTIRIVDESLNNSNNMVEMKEANRTTGILWIISVASLFGVLLQSDDVPIITYFTEKEQGVSVGYVLLLITSIIIVFCALWISFGALKSIVKWIMYKLKK